jgi:hypothetical protein
MENYQAQQAARASAAAALQASFPYLVPVSEKVDSLQAAAKNMRIELARAFPGVKFSVKSRRFSMGDAIDVRWIDGPVSDQVDAIIDRYSAGSFDGMQDLYEYSRDAWKDAFGDSKYVNSSRDSSDKAVESAIRTLRAKYGANFESRGIESVSIDDYRNNRLWSVDLLGGGRSSNSDLQSLISIELSRRTWALNKSPAVQPMADEVAA